MAIRPEGAARHSVRLLAGQAIATLALMCVSGRAQQEPTYSAADNASAGQCHRRAIAARSSRSR